MTSVAVDYQICTRCVMDTSDVEIVFDDAGVCNHCHDYDVVSQHRMVGGEEGERELQALAARIREVGRGKEYDCLLGVSGGVDSSFVAYQAHRLGLRPLAIHLDNGWDSELAFRNVESVVKRLGLDLYTHVVDWHEFRDLQLAFVKASVVDIEVLTDHAITALAYTLADKHGIGYILSGSNFATESIMPRTWGYRKSDLASLRGIQRRFGTVPIRTLPTASSLRLLYYQRVKHITTINVLDYLDYDKTAAMAILHAEVGWSYHAGKHFESIFTRFYQAHILLEKFGIDKRRAHLSSLVCSGQSTRQAALEELDHPVYDRVMLMNDRDYVLKKWRMASEEFDAYLATPPVPHTAYGTEDTYLVPLLRAARIARGGARRVRAAVTTSRRSDSSETFS